MTAAEQAPRARLRRWLPWLVIGGLLTLLGLAAATPSSQPLDPNGTGPTGAKALVLLLRHYGAVVSIDSSAPAPGVSAAVVLHDALDARRRAEVAGWVRAGGRLVVADPASALQPGAATSVGNGIGSGSLEVTGPCPQLGLDDVVRLSIGNSLVLRPPPGTPATTCYPAPVDRSDPAWFVVAASDGQGSVIGLGGAGVWSNARLDHDDNAALAVNLLIPVQGARVDILAASHAGSGTRSLLGLLNPRLKSAVIQLVIAFGVLAWWRGRRLGRPVGEPDAVQIPASEIVAAVGDLMARTRNRAAAAHELRDAARRWSGERLGLGGRASPEQVADVVAARLGGDRDAVWALLTDGPVPDDAALVRLAQSLVQFREEVGRGRSYAVR